MKKIKKLHPLAADFSPGHTLRKEQGFFMNEWRVVREVNKDGYEIVAQYGLPLSAKEDGYNAVIKDKDGQQYLAEIARY